MAGDKFNLVALVDVLEWIEHGWWAILLLAYVSMAIGALTAYGSMLFGRKLGQRK